MENVKSPRCMYKSSLKDFLKNDPLKIHDTIVDSFHGTAPSTAIDAWKEEIKILQDELKPWINEDAYVFFEYDIPRLGKRIDVVLLLRGIVFCLEFKVGQKDAIQADVEQVLDYALDLKNFHLFSENKTIVPILIPTQYRKKYNALQASPYHDQIYNPLIVSTKDLQNVINQIITKNSCDINPDEWGEKWIISPYSPTPTIIEAAFAYSGDR